MQRISVDGCRMSDETLRKASIDFMMEKKKRTVNLPCSIVNNNKVWCPIVEHFRFLQQIFLSVKNSLLAAFIHHYLFCG